MSGATLPPLLLAGGPAAGKSTTAAILAGTNERCAVIDVDNIRHLVVAGGAAPWKGNEGRTQQLLGIRNAASLAHNFIDAGFDVIICDVVTASTLGKYRASIPDILVVRLSIDLDEARRRSQKRTEFLTDKEFGDLHAAQAVQLAVDHEVDVSSLTVDEQAARIREHWRFGR